MNVQEKKKAAEIYQLSRGLTTTLQILVSDIQYAEDRLQNDPAHEQFWRRIVIRSVCALGEGTLNVMKGMIPKTADFFGVCLTDKEHEILSEKRKLADGTQRPFFLPIHDNLKATLKMFARIHNVQSQRDFNQGYEDFCATYELRNRLMHPRNHRELEVKNDTYRASIRGWNWFNFTLVAVLQECGKKLPFPPNK